MDNNLINAIKSSNHAAYLIETGNKSAAISRLKTALKLSRQTLERFDRDDGFGSTTLSLDEYMEPNNECFQNDSQTHDGCLVYQRAIRIPDLIGYNHDAQVKISAIIIFNLALAHQLLEVGGDKISTNRSLRQSIRLYELAFNLISEVTTETNLLFKMAITNNLGLAYGALDHTVLAAQCFQYLLSTLMSLTLSGEPKISHFDRFFEAASRYVFKPRSAPAA